MTDEARVALVGPAADAWRGRLSSRARRRLADDGPVSFVVLDPATPARAMVPESGHVVLLSTHAARPAAVPAGVRLWRTDEEPYRWLDDVLDALDRGVAVEDALARLEGFTHAPPPPPAPPPSVSPPVSPAPPKVRRTRPPLIGALIDRLRAAATGGATASPAPPPSVAPDRGDRSRRLIVAFWAGDTPHTRVLPPLTDVTLTVAIAVPREGDLAADQPIDVPQEPGQDAVVLEVTCSGTPWPDPQTQSILVPTADPSASSTLAAFDLVTPASGQVIALDITVAYRGRPLQVATIAAAVRERETPADRIDVRVRPTSSGPLPSTALTAGLTDSILVDARGTTLVNRRTGHGVQVDTGALLSELGTLLSRTLGRPDAPEDFDQPEARTLLIELARKGALLRERIAPLGIAETPAISLLVDPHGALIPLELVYDGPAPEQRADVTVCRHADAPCRGPSRRRVCPSAFWGASRSICRVVQLDDVRVEPREQVRLTPVLYASATRADHGSPAPPPSEGLLAQLSAGGAAAPERVTNWRQWLTVVRRSEPRLMVLLAHAGRDRSEPFLEVGRRSALALADLRPVHVAREGGAAPLVLLLACATAQAGDAFGSFHGALITRGAAAVVGTLSQVNGPAGARAGAAVLTALRAAAGASAPVSLGSALQAARSALLEQGQPVGLVLVSHGEIEQVVV